MIETIYLLLKDYIKLPFEFIQQRFGQTISFVVDQNELVKITHDSTAVYFYYLDVLVFTIKANDGFNLRTGFVEINSENRDIILKRL